MRTSLLTPLLVLVAVAGCRHIPSAKDQQAAVARHDLGVLNQQNGDIRAAWHEYDEALKLDPYFPEAWFAKAQLLHLSFGKPEEAIENYRKALEIRPEYSAAKNGLGTVYLDLGRYDEAIKLFEEALNDMRYPTPHIAQTNLGWAQFKKGEVEKAVESTRSAIISSPKFCAAHRNLGEILDHQGKTAESCESYTKFRESCPEYAEAYYREGVCLVKLGRAEEAKQAFAGCQSKAKPEQTFAKDCKLLADKLQAP